MKPLQVYRDDGPLAAAIGRRARARLPGGAVTAIALGVLPLLAVLAAARDAPPAWALLPAAAVFVAVASTGAEVAERGRIAWLGPPLLRLLEYGLVLRLCALADPGAMPVAYGLLAALAFHHYDAVYRLRHQRVAPPAWLRAAGGGWDGRTLLVCVLAVAGVLGPGTAVLAAVLATVFVAESVASWLRFARTERTARFGDDEDEELEAA
jgi:hypothetical protein